MGNYELLIMNYEYTFFREEFVSSSEFEFEKLKFVSRTLLIDFSIQFSFRKSLEVTFRLLLILNFAAMEFSSKLLENAVNEVSRLPGIGKRTALRLVLHLLKQPAEHTGYLAEALTHFRTDINSCKKCHNISDTVICEICNNLNRNPDIVCVVEDIRDVMAIESTAQYRGLYHVLGGKISPIEGIGPHNLQIESLVDKVAKGEIKELIFALSSTMEGDTTNFYIFKQIEKYEITTSTIARGISVGDELEYADEVTLGRSIVNRIPFEQSIKG
jgi:recombination protein RecR